MKSRSHIVRLSRVVVAAGALAACSSNSDTLPDSQIAAHVDARATIDAHATIDSHLHPVDGVVAIIDGASANDDAIRADAIPTSADARHAIDASSIDDARIVVDDAAPDATADAYQPVCGNNIVEAGEQCDDGNRNNFDACSNLCIAAGPMSLVSVNAKGEQGIGVLSEGYPAVSADGRYIAFGSDSYNLVTHDTNQTYDIFVRDMITGQVTRVSVDSTGDEANDQSDLAAISADGQTIAFTSSATNLVAGDTVSGVFVHDMTSGATTVASLSSTGQPATGGGTATISISGDGNVVAFDNGFDLVPGATGINGDSYIRDLSTNTTTLVSHSTSGGSSSQESYDVSTSGDGRYTVFNSWSGNLVAGVNPGFFQMEIFLFDRVTGDISVVSTTPSGVIADGQSTYPSISADGRYVAFSSSSDNIVPNDVSVNGAYVHDMVTGVTTMVSVSTDGTQATGNSFAGTLSADGRFVVFSSTGSNLVENDTNGVSDVFVHDMLTGVTTRVNVAADGGQDDGGAQTFTSISADGTHVVFVSSGDNLVAGDINDAADLFSTTGFPQQGVLPRIDGNVTSSSGHVVNISMTLGTQPTADVTVALSVSNSDEASLSTSSVTFTSNNWNVPQVVTVTGLLDINANANVPYTVDFANAVSSDPIYSGFVTPSASLINLDSN